MLSDSNVSQSKGELHPCHQIALFHGVKVNSMHSIKEHSQSRKHHLNKSLPTEPQYSCQSNDIYVKGTLIPVESMPCQPNSEAIIVQLRKKIDALLAEKEEDKEKLHMYQAQIRIMKEDFQLEREDRAREHTRANELKRELDTLKDEISAINRDRSIAHRHQMALENSNRYRQSRMNPVRYACDDGSDQPQYNRNGEDYVDSEPALRQKQQ